MHFENQVITYKSCTEPLIGPSEKPFGYSSVSLYFYPLNIPMYQLTLNMYETVGLAAVVLFVGTILVRHSKLLRRFFIPAAVVGGMLFAIVSLCLYSADIVEIQFDDTLRQITMMVFFCSIGFLASFKMLKAGGKLVSILVVLMLVLILMQNGVGIMCADIFGLDSKYGLALGSISLCGGHGTAAAYGKLLVDDYGLVGADSVCLASATFGLALAGFIGGPLAKRLVWKHRLEPSTEDYEFKVKEPEKLQERRFLTAASMIAVCLGAGAVFNLLFEDTDITLPIYLGAMLIAFVFRNTAEKIGVEVPVREVEILGWVCLCLFLSMALMSIKLWELEDLALAMVVTLLIQAVALGLFVYYLVFRATGKNYESAALVTGVAGFGMGAIPNAIANMEALIREHGPAPVAYFVVPIIGGVFLDIINVVVLTVLLNLL